MVGFQFLVITSLLSGYLMFSVTCYFSHCDLALVLRKQCFFFIFSVCEERCCWKIQPTCGYKIVAAMLAGKILRSFCPLS